MNENNIRTSRTVESGISRPKRPVPPCMGEGCGYCVNPIPIRPPQSQPPLQPRTDGPSGKANRESRLQMRGYPAMTAEPAYPSLAMGYVPSQRWGQTYPPAQGLVRGTIFPDLDRPFLTRRCR